MAFSFGTAPASSSAAPPAFSFGSSTVALSTADKQQQPFSFGTNTSTAAAPTGGISFGPSLATSTGVGGNQLSTGFQFGGGSSTSLGGTLGGGSIFGTNTTSTPAGAVGSSQSPLKGLGGAFGLTATTSATPSLTFGSVTTSMGGGVGGIGGGGIGGGAVGSGSSQLLGLGGSALGSSSVGNPPSQGKDTPVSSEILQSVEEFKKFCNEQKKLREDVSKFSPQCLQKVAEEWTTLRQQSQRMKAFLQKLSAQTKALKQSALKTERFISIAQRTHETTLSMQFENTAPNEYFQRLSSELEAKVDKLRSEIESLEYRMSVGNPSAITPKDLVEMMRWSDEQFLHTAASLYNIHEHVQRLRDSFLKQHYAQGFRDDPFASVSKSQQAVDYSLSNFASHDLSVTGPDPFSQDTVMMQQCLLPASKAMPSGSTAGGSFVSQSIPSLGFGSITAGLNTTGVGGGILQLQDVPSGKRKK